MTNNPNWRLPVVPTFELTSPDFVDGGDLPAWSRYDGGNRSPGLAWSRAPEGTKSYVVTLYDPDAPTGSGFWHWAVHDIPAEVTQLAAGVGSDLPEGAVIIGNELRQAEYMGAAPPPGDGVHRYFFTVNALDVATLELAEGASPAILGITLRGHLLARAQIIGTQKTEG
jgi:Raf kinase inhibitor-like YbhB/YbcL family protein